MAELTLVPPPAGPAQTSGELGPVRPLSRPRLVVDAGRPTEAPVASPPPWPRRAADGTRVHEVWTNDGVRLAMTEVLAAGDRRAVPGANAPVFLLVPGFAQNRRAFLEGPLPQGLARRGARVFIGELRGHGRSRGTTPPPRWTIDGHVDHDLPAFAHHAMRITGARRVHYVGHSLGGMLALAWLDRRPPLASLTTFATPLRIGSDRPIVRLAATVARAVNAFRPWREVPMRGFLGALAETLSAPNPDPVRRWLQRYTALASPHHAPPDALERILGTADPESPEVFEALLDMARRGDATLGRYDLLRLARRTEVPWIAVHGSRDIFAPPSSLAPMLQARHAGPRWVFEVEGATHVDIAMGHHVEALVGRCWDLLFPS